MGKKVEEERKWNFTGATYATDPSMDLSITASSEEEVDILLYDPVPSRRRKSIEGGHKDAPTGGARVFYWDSYVGSVNESIISLFKRVSALEALKAEHLASYQLHELGDDRFEVKNPIPIIIKFENDEYIVEQPELELYAYDEVLSVALGELKDDIVEMIEDTILDEHVKLGAGARRRRRSLEAFVLVRED